MAAVATIGEMAPEFSLRDQAGRAVRLADLRGTKRALLVFYPKDLTTG